MTCAECDIGHYLNDTCVKCPVLLTNCVACSDKDTCTACDDDYHVSGGVCIMDCDVLNCAACEADPLTCKTCEAGFFVDGKLAPTVRSNYLTAYNAQTL